uniref:Uncharacterized protein n=1 Tax=Myoviridae sp. ctoNH1 TaxID=2826695 RepID=A0A8S5QST2_9CAUD|nr:MAG TPA: hypothetical protein [Myoviridae sp. ctoNH1]
MEKHQILAFCRVFCLFLPCFLYYPELVPLILILI